MRPVTTQEVFEVYKQEVAKYFENTWQRKVHQGTDGRAYRSDTMFTTVEGKPCVLADSKRFRVISELLFYLAGEYLINGWSVEFKNVGYLQGAVARVKGLRPDWKATNEYCKANNLEVKKENMIFYTEPFYRFIKFFEKSTNSNKGLYTFRSIGASKTTVDSASLRRKFAQALSEDPSLGKNYREV